MVQCPFPPRQLTRLLGGFPRMGGGDALGHDRPRHRGILLEERAEALVDQRLHDALHFRVAQLGLGLALELRLRDLDRDDRGEPFLGVVAAEFYVLEHAVPLRVGVDAPRQRPLESREMGASFPRVDVVREREDVLLVGIVVLEGELHLYLPALLLVADDVMQRQLVLVEELHERGDASLVEELVLLARALVHDGDAHPAVEEGKLPQPGGDRVEMELDHGKNLVIGDEGDARPPLRRLANLLDRGEGNPPSVFLLENLPLPLDGGDQGLGEGVRDGDADAVQPS